MRQEVGDPEHNLTGQRPFPYNGISSSDFFLLSLNRTQSNRHTKGEYMDGVMLLVFALLAGCLSDVFGCWLTQEWNREKRKKP